MRINDFIGETIKDMWDWEGVNCVTVGLKGNLLNFSIYDGEYFLNYTVSLNHIRDREGMGSFKAHVAFKEEWQMRKREEKEARMKIFDWRLNASD